MGRYLCFLLLFASPASFATSTVTAITSSSGATFTTGTLGIAGQAVTVVLGLAGASDCTATAPCNSCLSCTDSAFCTCNTNQLGDNIPITISFISDNTTAPATVTVGSSSGQVITTIPQSAYGGAGSTNQITTTLGQLCSVGTTTGGTLCSGLTNGQQVNFYVGITSNGTTLLDSVQIVFQILKPTNATVDDCSGTNTSTAGGVCNFRARAGDGSIYIDDISVDGNFPGSTTGIRAFVSSTSFPNAGPNTADTSSDFSVGSDGTVSGGIITGLQNDTVVYQVRLATLDAAGDVYNFLSDTNIQSASFGNCSGADYPTVPLANSADACRYKALPDPVLGLLSKDLNCFIATAAYGSSLEPKLNTFRRFRNEYLNYSRWGRKFIFSYYHWGPYAARWIADRDWARSAARVGLWPLWAFSSLSLAIGLEKAILIALMTLVSFTALIAAVTSWVRTPRAKVS